MIKAPSDENEDEYTIYFSQLPEAVQQDILSMIKYVFSASDIEDDEHERCQQDSDKY